MGEDNTYVLEFPEDNLVIRLAQEMKCEIKFTNPLQINFFTKTNVEEFTRRLLLELDTIRRNADAQKYQNNKKFEEELQKIQA